MTTLLPPHRCPRSVDAGLDAHTQSWAAAARDTSSLRLVPTSRARVESRRFDRRTP